MGPYSNSEYYVIRQTPIDVPLRFNNDGYFRITSKAECKKCGRGFMQVLRCHRYRSDFGVLMVGVKRPDPNDERVETSFMLAVLNHGVGKPELHKRGCEIGRIKRTGKFRLEAVGMRKHS